MTKKSNGNGHDKAAAKKSKSFEDWHFADLTRLFRLARVPEGFPLLDEWMATTQTVSEGEQKTLKKLRDMAADRIHGWSEEDLKVNLVGYDTDRYAAFYDRSLEASLEDVRLGDKVDFMVALGAGKPYQPFFFCTNQVRTWLKGQRPGPAVGCDVGRTSIQ